MKTLLRIDCSPRISGSHSRALANYFEEKWKQKHPDGVVICRDLMKSDLPHLQNSTIQGFYTPTESFSEETKRATILSDELIMELMQANELLISYPMYNFNIPSNLKAYIDQIVRINYTFGINDSGYYGLLKGKKAFVISAKGGVYKDTHLEKYDFLEQYLEVLLGHIGIEIGSQFSLEGTSDNIVLEKNIKNMNEQIDAVLKPENNEN
nr:NAD(P)H-dependent oxidoreductase [uncultured Allomuricauda sp.]